MLTSTAYAAQTGTPGGLGAFMPLIILFIIFYFLLIRPQQKRAKDHQATIDALKIGDTIITNGGIYGTITRIDGNLVTIQCSDRVFIKIIKKAVSQKVDPVTMEGMETDELKS
ncbi:preprotein translocase subunit YajC [bacterium]|nr:MAG: preprotein translocase subunit YajC [bacterium]